MITPSAWPAQVAVECGELQRLGRGESEPGNAQPLARFGLEEMPALEDQADPVGEQRLAPPVELHLTHAVMPDCRRAEKAARQFDGRCAVDQRVDLLVERRR